MAESLKKVLPGQRLRVPAEAYNAFVDAARDFRSRTRNIEGEPKRADPMNSGVILVKNGTSARQRFEVLGISQPIILPTENLDAFKSRPMLVGIVPTLEHVDKFFVLQEPLAAGAIGRAVVSGVSIVRLDVQDDADRMAWATEGNTANLRSGNGGVAQILWKESGTGICWAVVRLGCGTLPGIRQYQVYQMVTDNVPGWDWLRSHGT